MSSTLARRSGFVQRYQLAGQRDALAGNALNQPTPLNMQLSQAFVHLKLSGAWPL